MFNKDGGCVLIVLFLPFVPIINVFRSNTLSRLYGLIPVKPSMLV
jgi:hypothetical protein